jgi:hypothetical protein
MRFLFRLAVLALAAVGVKALFDRFAPKAAELRGPATDVLESAKSAARGVSQHAKDAAADVADDARQRAAELGDQTSTAIGKATDIVSADEPTIANATPTTY